MSDEPPEFLQGLPVLFFHEDPEAKRQRVEGAQPAPSSVRWPRLGETAEPGPGGLEYPLIQFPWEPWWSGLGTQSLARAYASWLNDTAPGRVAAIMPLLAQAGAPVAGLREDPGILAGLGRWIQQLFPVLAASLIEQGFLKDDPEYRIGWGWRARSPRSQGYSRYLDALLGSMAHDLAFIVADCARAVRPGLAWQPYFEVSRQGFVVGVDPGAPGWDLIEQITDFLVQSAARPRGTRGRDLRDWYGLTLLHGFERAARGTATADARQVFPDVMSTRGGARRYVLRPARSDPAAPAELVAAVDVLRAAGWFETVKFSTPDLARAAQAAWRCFEGSDILPAAAARMYWRLLILDAGRTWSDDVDAGVRLGDPIYGYLVEEVSQIRGKALGRLWSADQDWASRPGDLLLSFRSRHGKQQLLIPSPGPYLSAALFTGLNELAAPDEPRLWFADQGPPVGVVTRATAAERAALQDATGLRLDPDPPHWWTSLAPLPGQHDKPPAAAARPRRAPARRAPASPGPAAPPGPVKGRKATAPSGRSSGERDSRTAGGGPVTAQAAFEHLMRDLVAPALRELGFTGNGARWFAYRSGDYAAVFATQKSVYSTKEEVEFWVHLSAMHLPTGSPYWNTQLRALVPGWLSHWTVRADSPVEPVAEDLLGAFRRYGWPAIQAALDSPGYPPDPAVTWPRSFAPDPSPAVLGAAGPSMGPLTWPLRRTGELGDLLTDISDPDEYVRAGAVDDLGAAASHDPQILPILLNRLQHDPRPSVRSAAARALIPLAGQPQVHAAFRAAADQDEDHQVRWGARYALRLAELPGQTDSR